MASISQLLGGAGTTLLNIGKASRGEKLLDPVGDSIRAKQKQREALKKQEGENFDRLLKMQKARREQQEHNVEIVTKAAKMTSEQLNELARTFTNFDFSNLIAMKEDERIDAANRLEEVRGLYNPRALPMLGESSDPKVLLAREKENRKALQETSKTFDMADVRDTFELAKLQLGRRVKPSDDAFQKLLPRQQQLALENGDTLADVFKQTAQAGGISNQVELALRSAGVKPGQEPTPEQALQAITLIKGGGQVITNRVTDPEGNVIETIVGGAQDVKDIAGDTGLRKKAERLDKFKAIVPQYKALDASIQDVIGILKEEPDINTLGTKLNNISQKLFVNARSVVRRAGSIKDGDDGKLLRQFKDSGVIPAGFFSEELLFSSKRFEGLMFALAIDAARVLAEQKGRGLSDQDVIRFLKQVGADESTAPAIMGKLSALRSNLFRAANTQAEAVGEPPVFIGDGSVNVKSMSAEELLKAAKGS